MRGQSSSGKYGSNGASVEAAFTGQPPLGASEAQTESEVTCFESYYDDESIKGRDSPYADLRPNQLRAAASETAQSVSVRDLCSLNDMYSALHLRPAPDGAIASRAISAHMHVTTANTKFHIDDAGYDEDSVAALIGLANAGRVASFSVLANGLQLLALATWYNRLDHDERPAVFLHFNLVEGRPSGGVTDSLTSGGLFRSKLGVVWQCWLGRISIDQVTVELRAQLLAVRELGFDVVGIDSHQHMHGLSPVSAAVLDVARMEELQVRSLAMFMTTSVLGRCKRALFGLACSLSEVPVAHRFRRPTVWRQRSWIPYVVASWEPVSMGNAVAGAVIICHPALGCDRSDAV
jgi:hypothetical protein